MDITLYYTPRTFYSGKVLMMLYEMDAPFKEKFVNLIGNEHFESWFERLNPKRQVPVLKCGKDIIPDSDAIIDYLSREIGKGRTQLVPDKSTALGEEVNQFRKYMSQLPIRCMTYGLSMNPRLQLKRMRFPDEVLNTLTRKSLEKYIDTSIECLRKKMKSNSEDNGNLDAELEELHHVKAIVMDETRVSDIFDDLEQAFDKIEQMLESSKRSTSNGAFWLFGSEFTVADISAAIFLYRIYELGMDERYFSENKRPVIMSYYQILTQRPSFQKMVAKMDAAVKLISCGKGGTSALKWMKISMVVGVAAVLLIGGKGIWAARRGFSKA